MAAPSVRCVTFSKLLSIHRATGLVCSRWYRTGKNEHADMTPEQVEKNSPERIDKEPGPWKNFTNLQFWKKEGLTRHYGEKFNEKLVDEMLAKMDITKDSTDDMPVEMPDPYQRPFKKCLICQHDVQLDYKNVQLLSQFISPYTGRVYGRHITGLCIPMQRRVQSLISKAQRTWLMPMVRKTPEYLTDPTLFKLKQKTYPYGE